MKQDEGDRPRVTDYSLTNVTCELLASSSCAIKQIDFVLTCVCTVIDHRWRHSVERTKKYGTGRSRVP